MVNEAKTGESSGPRLSHAALVTVVGYVMGWGVPFASFSILPKLFSADDGAKTMQNIVAHPSLFVTIIFAFLINFVGDVVAAWGLYLLLRRANAAAAMFAAWLRVVFATLGVAATLNLVTTHRLLTQPAYLKALGQNQLETHVQIAMVAFHAQFAFSLIIFGVYLILLGWLVHRSGYIPSWLGVVLMINGAGWIVMEAGPYLAPGVHLRFLFVATFGELIFLAWLVGWGTRLGEPAANYGASFSP